MERYDRRDEIEEDRIEKVCEQREQGRDGQNREGRGRGRERGFDHHIGSAYAHRFTIRQSMHTHSGSGGGDYDDDDDDDSDDDDDDDDNDDDGGQRVEWWRR